MIVVEGMLAMPERSLMGKALWKPRYVVLGSETPLRPQNDLFTHLGRRSMKASSVKGSQVDVSQTVPQRLYLSIYKAKGDEQYIDQKPLDKFETCEIRYIAHRKHSPAVQTLVLGMKPNLSAEKQCRRRSRTSVFSSIKDPRANISQFRTIPDERYSIYDWKLMIESSMTSQDTGNCPVSPGSPIFTNPFASRDPWGSGPSIKPDRENRSQSSILPPNRCVGPSAFISPSPSLRSRPSNLSSQSSSQNLPLGFTTAYLQNLSLPKDVSSPPSSPFNTFPVEERTLAQGRSPTLSSHTGAGKSIPSGMSPNAIIASTPPAPRETILDRAFQMRCIPGSERIQDSQDVKMSSMARFEALMREQDELKRQEAKSNREHEQRPKWGDDLDYEAPGEGHGVDDIEDRDMSDNEVDISTPAQRALAYISNRRTRLRNYSPAPTFPPIPFVTQNCIASLQDSFASPFQGCPPRTNLSYQHHSRPTSLVIEHRTVSETTLAICKDSNLSVAEKRRSSASMRRINLNFQGFSKRLSSTSSLLLVQSNASSGSSRDGLRRSSVDCGGTVLGVPVTDAEDEEIIMNTGNRRGTSKAKWVNVAAREGTVPTKELGKRCGWIGNMGILDGAEDAFI